MRMSLRDHEHISCRFMPKLLASVRLEDIKFMVATDVVHLLLNQTDIVTLESEKKLVVPDCVQAKPLRNYKDPRQDILIIISLIRQKLPETEP